MIHCQILHAKALLRTQMNGHGFGHKKAIFSSLVIFDNENDLIFHFLFLRIRQSSEDSGKFVSFISSDLLTFFSRFEHRLKHDVIFQILVRDSFKKRMAA